MKSNTLKLGLIALVALMLIACGDDGSGGGSGPSGTKHGSSERYDGKKCKHNSELVIGGEGIYQNTYVCDADTFRRATKSEKEVGLGCTSYNLGDSARVGGYMNCSESGVWTVSTSTVAGTMTDSRDGTTYKTIGIGTQTWMAENLNYEYKVAGSTYGNWCYNNSADSCAKYGRLYSWAAAMDSVATGCGYEECEVPYDAARGVCPQGWRLPAHTDWWTLLNNVGGGEYLKSTSGWPKDTSNQSQQVADAWGFSVYPSGCKNANGDSYGACLWVSTLGCARFDAYGSGSISPVMNGDGCSIRCLKD